MYKTIRDAVFTVIMLVLTAIGLNWNTTALQKQEPSIVSQSVLNAHASTTFPIDISFAQASVNLGQEQKINLATNANSQLKIMVEYADGTVAQAFQASANNDGTYALNFSGNNFREVGVVVVMIVAKSGNQTSQVESEFNLTAPAQ
jgi:hypothetical protein